jgi:hypothetical protein
VEENMWGESHKIDSALLSAWKKPRSTATPAVDKMNLKPPKHHSVSREMTIFGALHSEATKDAGRILPVMLWVDDRQLQL